MAYNEQITSAVVSAGGTLAAGTSIVPVLVAPFGGATIQSGYFAATNAVAANGSNYVTATLINAGTAGTATTAIGTAGGTAGITGGGTPQAFTLNSALDELSAGEFLYWQTVRTGSTSSNEFTGLIKWVHGKG